MKIVIKLVFLTLVLQGCEISTINYYSCPEQGIKKNTILNTQLNDSLAGKKH